MVRGAGADHRPEAGASQGEEVDLELRVARRPGDRRVGDAARRADVGVPRPVRDGGDARVSATSADSARKSFDGRGNYTLGIKEQMIFPEINYDMVEQIHGMDITFVTTATKDDHAFALLHQLGMPFKGDDKPVTPKVSSRAAAA